MLAQFCKEYDPYRKPKGKKTKGFLDREKCSSDEDDNHSENEQEVECDESFGTEQQVSDVSKDVAMKDRIHVASDGEIFRLPNLIKLENTAEGEAEYMKRKKIPNAIRIHNVQDKNSHEWLYSQCLLYHPFKNEIKDMKAARERQNECQRLFLHSETPNSV